MTYLKYILLLVLLLTTSPAWAVYYVSQNGIEISPGVFGSVGSDAFSCTAIQNPSTPARQIQRAVDCVATSGSGAGKEVRVYAGTYNDFTPTQAASGSGGNYLLIRPNPGAAAVIVPRADPFKLEISNTTTRTSFIQFGEIGNGFDIDLGTNEGGFSVNFGTNIRIYGNQIRNGIGDGVHVSGGTNIEIRGNWFHHNGSSVSQGLTGHAIYAADDIDLLDINGNLIEDHGNAAGGWAVHVYGGATGSLVRRITVRNNVIRRIASTGVACMNQDASFGSNFCVIYNNQISQTGGFGGIFLSAARNSQIYNNSLYQTGGINYEASSNVIIRNNISTNGITNLGGNSGTITVNTNLTSDPGWVNPSGGNFQLGAGAATAIDQGVDLSGLGLFTTDIVNSFIGATGITRSSHGSSWDIGVFERNQGGGDTTPPVVAITAPNGGDPLETDVTPLTTMAGTCSDAGGVSSVTWINNLGGSGTATGTTSWSIPSIALSSGANVITVTCTDTSSNTHNDQQTITYSSPAVDPELVLAMAMDANGGTSVVDTSGKSNNGTFAGSGTAWTTGQYGSGLFFGGSGYVSVPDSNSLDLTTAFSLMAWVKPSAASTSYRMIMGKATTGGSNLYGLFATVDSAFCTAGRVMGFFSNGSTLKTICSTTALTPNVMTHVAVTYDGSNLRLYLDGVLDATVAADGVIPIGTGIVRIGSSPFDEFFTGVIDEPRIYTYARDLTQIGTDKDTRITEPPGDPVLSIIFGASGSKFGPGALSKLPGGVQ